MTDPLNLTGCFAFVFALLAAFVLWRIEQRGPAETITDRFQQHDRWN